MEGEERQNLPLLARRRDDRNSAGLGMQRAENLNLHAPSVIHTLHPIARGDGHGKEPRSAGVGASIRCDRRADRRIGAECLAGMPTGTSSVTGNEDVLFGAGVR
ncbi:hypothetical protein GCM10010430_34240 [Kitasatospora cystarginea]|uniref:Uncharacterized protein n=1 Tax=Kitasatospora cystarginea TaxID=58350 RepID=A0ABP5R0X1_9ACTN